MKLGDESLTVALFQNFPIRRIWHQGEWWYSIVDVMRALSQSPRPRKYWSDLKRDLAAEGYDVSAHIGQIPLPIEDGRKFRTDCANIETLLRLVQSVKSPNAEPFKIWLAAVGAAHVPPELIGETEQRLEYHEKLVELDETLMSVVTFRGVLTAEQRQAFKDSGFDGLYGGEWESDIADRKHLYPGDDIRLYMSAEEQADNIFHRAQTKGLIERRNIRGAENLNTAAYDTGVEIRLTLERMGAPMPEDLPRVRRLPKQLPGETEE